MKDSNFVLMFCCWAMAVMMMMVREVEQRLSGVERFERMMSSRVRSRLYTENTKWRLVQAISLVGGACFAAHLDDFIGRRKPPPKSRSKTLGSTEGSDWSIRVWGLVCALTRACALTHARTCACARRKCAVRRCGVSERRAGCVSGSRRYVACSRVSRRYTDEKVK